jgi:periplasmic copper chaperone A
MAIEQFITKGNVMNKVLMSILLAAIFLTACDNKAPATSTNATDTNVSDVTAAPVKPAIDSTKGVIISDNWVRANQPGQSVGAAYMTLTSPIATSLVKIESRAAGSVMMHSMNMENNVMKMRMLDELPLKPNMPEKLAPGGFHLMMFELAKPLTLGDSVTFTLHFKDAAGKISQQDVVSMVKDAP